MSAVAKNFVAEVLEQRIKDKGAEAMRLAVARNTKAARACYADMAALIRQRSPETVRRLELERGLR